MFSARNLYLRQQPLQFSNHITSHSKILLGQKRPLMGFVRNALGLEPPPSPNDPTPENRFHPWDQSPSEALRERAARIKALAHCPVTGKNIEYTCPISGIPTHHSREAWEKDKYYHDNKIYDILKKVNIYEHDLRSGRPFPEFEFPQEQGFDRMVNMTNWDLFFYTRGFYSMDTEFQLAAVTKMLSYPITIGALLSQFSPYALNPKGPITLEGLKSLAALRYTLYSSQRSGGNSNTSSMATTSMTNQSESSTGSLLKNRPMRIFILGARAESQLPGHVWKQLQYLFPGQKLDIIFIGPECYFDRNKQEYIRSAIGAPPIVNKIDETLRLLYYTDFFHRFHESQDFFPYDPYFDCFFTFHPGYASPENTEHWMNETIPALLDTKCPVFTTGFDQSDLMNDMNLLEQKYASEMDILMDPIKNIFGSTKWELNDLNPHEVYRFNMYIAGYRGKRYHTVET
ncbi:translational activator for mitochondrial COX1 [Monosporozyma unispora]|nr:translational activator for mitochondrial COX1 [Kazachstania unispora]